MTLAHIVQTWNNPWAPVTISWTRHATTAGLATPTILACALPMLSGPLSVTRHAVIALWSMWIASCASWIAGPPTALPESTCPRIGHFAHWPMFRNAWLYGPKRAHVSATRLALCEAQAGTVGSGCVKTPKKKRSCPLITTLTIDSLSRITTALAYPHPWIHLPHYRPWTRRMLSLPIILNRAWRPTRICPRPLGANATRMHNTLKRKHEYTGGRILIFIFACEWRVAPFFYTGNL